MSLNNTSSEKRGKAAAAALEDRFEFIPYHSHYNPHTLLTKNGELMQIIRVNANLNGDECENLDGVHATLCTALREVLTASEVSEKFSFWLHTIRRRSEMPSREKLEEDKPSDDFAQYVEKSWERAQNWEKTYKNEVYLTILYEGQAAPLFDGKNPKFTLFPNANKKFRGKYLEDSYQILDKIVISVLEEITTQYRANRLTLVERALPSAGKVARPSIFYSEPLEFLGYLFNLQTESFPLTDVDLSVALQTSKLTFGFNAVEAKSNVTGKRRYASLLTLKQYRNMFMEDVDPILQAPIEMVVTQSFTFIPSKLALKDYSRQKELFDTSGDLKANEIFGINQIMEYNTGSKIDFGEHQLSFMVVVDDLKDLDADSGEFLNRFRKLGLIVVREDILTEEIFLSQLPGNFEFIRRRSPIATGQLAGFCRLNRFNMGNAAGNHWGKALATIPTSMDSPYFFNFHVGDNGHTVLFDNNGFEDSMGRVLEYFLLTKTRKYGTKIFLFDHDHSARALSRKMGGVYYPMTYLGKSGRDFKDDTSTRLNLNPFNLEDSRHNRAFLASWCSLLIAPDMSLADAKKDVLRAAVERLYSLPQSERNLPSIYKIIAGIDPELATGLEKWIGKGERAGIFDFAEDSLNLSSDFFALDMTSAVKNSDYLLPLFAYLMHRVISVLDGRPTVIVLNEAWKLLENAFFAPRLESLLEMLKERNVMVLFTTSSPAEAKNTSTLATLLEVTASRIYVPDDVPVAYQSRNIGLSEQDELMLLSMNRQRGAFLLKQKGDSIALKAFMPEIEDAVATFANDLKALTTARGRFSGIPEDY